MECREHSWDEGNIHGMNKRMIVEKLAQPSVLGGVSKYRLTAANVWNSAVKYRTMCKSTDCTASLVSLTRPFIDLK
jgi:hypothetical protein